MLDTFKRGYANTFYEINKVKWSYEKQNRISKVNYFKETKLVALIAEIAEGYGWANAA